MQLYCVGDSFVYGYGVTPRQRWTELCAQALGWPVQNLGVNGDTLPGMLARLQGRLLPALERDRAAAAQSMVLICGGYNDIFCAGTDSAARACAAAIFQQLLAAGVCPVALIPPRSVTDAVPESWRALADPAAVAPVLDAYGDWLKQYCAVFQIPALDLRPVFTDAGANPRRTLYLDGIHPSPEGHAIIAEAVAALLREVSQT